jgi:bacterioferritin
MYSAMPADKEIISHLNAVLKSKLTGINQYFLHARILKHAGDMQLADVEYKASLGAMKHSDMLVEHILSLGGRPNLQELGRLSIGETADEMMQGDLALAETMVAQITSAITVSERGKDIATAALLAKILESQQERVSFLQSQITTHRKDCA